MYYTVFNHSVRNPMAQQRFAVYRLLYARKNKNPLCPKHNKHFSKRSKHLRNLFMNTNSGKKPKYMAYNPLMPCWVEMIHDLVFGAGFSYSRIAYRIRVSPSTIQKLATDLRRKPRHHVFHALLCLHQKVFEGENVRPEVLAYWNNKQSKK